jgi:HNH endonuclease
MKQLPSRLQIASSARPRREVVLEPLSAERYRIQLNASAQLKRKLEHAVDLLSHSNPSGELSVVIERALDLLIQRVERERFGQTKSPRGGLALALKKSKKSVKIRAFHGVIRQRIPNDTKRQIASRDGLRCTFVGSDGQRCAATKFTQIHHEHPWARGGSETVENLRILCASHNRLLAERDFGRALVADRIAKPECGAREITLDAENPTPLT